MASMEMIKDFAQSAGNCQANVPPVCKSLGICIPDANGVSFAESKSASKIAYEGNVGDKYTFPDGKEWEVIEVAEDKLTGYRDVVLKPVDLNDNRIILAFAGTDDLNDLATDIAQASGYVTPKQYEEAALRARKIKEKYPDLELRLTGHSLGGGLASYASAMNDCIPSTGINSAPLNGITLMDAVLKGCDKTTHYNTEWELIHNTFGQQLGSQISVYSSVSGLANAILGGIPRHFLDAAAPCVPPPKLKEGSITKQKREAEEKRKKEITKERLKQLQDELLGQENSWEEKKRRILGRKKWED